jgi:hypothetical protein
VIVLPVEDQAVRKLIVEKVMERLPLKMEQIRKIGRGEPVA